MPASLPNKKNTENCLQEKLQKNWITSGKLGSRDAVLVFRTNILNPKSRKSILQRASEECEFDNEDNEVINSNQSQEVSADNEIMLKHTNQEKNDKSVKQLFKINTKFGLISNIDKLHNESSSETSTSSDENEVCLKKESNTSEEEQEATSEEDNEFGKIMPAHQLHVTYKFIQTETKLLRKILNVHGLIEVEGESEFNLLWSGVHMKLDTLRNLALYQRVNHFPRSYEITRKDRLYKNIERMQHLRGMKHFDIVPQSFILPQESKDLMFVHNKYRGPWIVKPAASSRGRGIFIVNSPDQIPQDEQVLVSKYIFDPLCIDGHKCDLRVYVLVTSFDPLIIYLYEEGIVRLATVRYDQHTDNLWNPCMHLCNYSINKHHSDYIKSSDAQDEDVGHKWTLSALLRHLKLQGCNTHLLMLNIEDVIIKAVLACAQTIISACRMFVPNVNNCFELYGFDILIDNTLKPWLLEANLSPSMGVDSPLDTKVKACLATDLLSCVGIPAFTPEMKAHYDNKSTRLRSSSCHKQVDPNEMNGSNRSTKSSKNKKPIILLTQEEQRILRAARLQYNRRGGFVRIFPTEDSMQRYGHFLDAANGIPLSTPNVQGQTFQALVMQHNYNQMLHTNLFCTDLAAKTINDNSQENRLKQYERALDTDTYIPFMKKHTMPKCEEEGRRLRKQVLKKIANGSTLTHFQSRQTFSLYLEAVLHRLAMDPKDFHEKIILKFLSKCGGGLKLPVLQGNTPNKSKARSAMVAKLLGDFLEAYKRDTDTYIDSFDHFGMIPSSAYNLFLKHAQENDLEAVLTHHTNVTGIMPFLYNRCGLSVPATPPIPSGLHGFLRALPSMVSNNGVIRDVSKYDGYVKHADRSCENDNLTTKKSSFLK